MIRGFDGDDVICGGDGRDRIEGGVLLGGDVVVRPEGVTLASDLAIFGQAGPKHGSAPDGGSTDFLPWMLSIEDAMWNCVSCEMWSAYKMKHLGLISKCVPVLRDGDGWVRNPGVITDRYIEDGEVVNDETLPLLAGMASACALAGADIVAPSDMMDGRVGAIRVALDLQGLEDVAIMSYSAKYASAIRVTVTGEKGSHEAAGIPGRNGEPRLVALDGYEVDAVLASSPPSKRDDPHGHRE